MSHSRIGSSQLPTLAAVFSIAAGLMVMGTRGFCQAPPPDNLPPTDPGALGIDRSHTNAFEGQISTFTSRAAMSAPKVSMPKSISKDFNRLTLSGDYNMTTTQGSTWHNLGLSLDNSIEGWSLSYGYYFGEDTGHSLIFRSEFARYSHTYREQARVRLQVLQKALATRAPEIPDDQKSKITDSQTNARDAYLAKLRGAILGWNVGWLSFPGEAHEYSARIYLYSMLTHVDKSSSKSSWTHTASLGPAYRRIIGNGEHVGGKASYSLRWQNHTPSADDISTWKYRLGLTLVGQTFEDYKSRGGAFLTAEFKDARSGVSVYGAIGRGLNNDQVVTLGFHVGPRLDFQSGSK